MIAFNILARRQRLRRHRILAVRYQTTLHWTAKQGRVEAVDMVRAGMNVNIRLGYTAFHLASIHGHHYIIHLLINTYNARTNIRDYHGKHAVHYWSGSADAFNKPSSQSCGKWSSKRLHQPALSAPLSISEPGEP
ncbi:ankyrin repeat domain-containing protein SOWAHC isoform X2 [Coregonus clupeaformis]|uniref:ankyrin repeat domain-containing protein SOWAHC isoform X2 n=1 Tax=Coregonus clupeaformis TaxID=59861 RepID=UPI001BE0053E|nr:ankyrin repeat domain-containing protein SOWAHC isoform X2 [Coregonus clupeaformis]